MKKYFDTADNSRIDPFDNNLQHPLYSELEKIFVVQFKNKIISAIYQMNIILFFSKSTFRTLHCGAPPAPYTHAPLEFSTLLEAALRVGGPRSR